MNLLSFVVSYVIPERGNSNSTYAHCVCLHACTCEKAEKCTCDQRCVHLLVHVVAEQGERKAVKV